MALITITIGNAPPHEWESLDDVDESWISQQITRQQRAGLPVCVLVEIRSPRVSVNLTTGQCPSRPGGRPAYPDERPVIDLWNERTGKNGRVHPGDIVSFLKQLRSYL